MRAVWIKAKARAHAATSHAMKECAMSWLAAYSCPRAHEKKLAITLGMTRAFTDPPCV